MKELQPLAKEVVESYKNILLSKRRPEQVNRMLKDKRLIGYAEKTARNIIKWNVGNVQDFIQAQFFALNYMPYLPSMMHIASEKSLERYEKVKKYHRFISQKQNTAKLRKSQGRKLHFDKEMALGIVGIQPFEEKDKQIFYNELEGFSLCLESTSLFHPKSNLCKGCKHRKVCMKILVKRCKPLFQMRLGIINEKTFLKKMKKEEYQII